MKYVLKRFSPHTRGVILQYTNKKVHALCFPRTCGGDPTVPVYGRQPILFSPHLRG